MASNERTRGAKDFREGKSWTVCIALGLVLFAVLLSYPPPNLSAKTREHVVHVVLVWLNEPGNAADRAQIVETTRALAQATGAEDVRVGAVLPSKRPVVDDSFDIGLYMVFPSREALQAYLTHPAHEKAVESILRPLSRKTIVYDFEDHDE